METHNGDSLLIGEYIIVYILVSAAFSSHEKKMDTRKNMLLDQQLLPSSIYKQYIIWTLLSFGLMLLPFLHVFFLVICWGPSWR